MFAIGVQPSHCRIDQDGLQQLPSSVCMSQPVLCGALRVAATICKGHDALLGDGQLTPMHVTGC